MQKRRTVMTNEERLQELFALLDEMEAYYRVLGKVSFEFMGQCDIERIGRIIALHCLWCNVKYRSNIQRRGTARFPCNFCQKFSKIKESSFTFGDKPKGYFPVRVSKGVKRLERQLRTRNARPYSVKENIDYVNVVSIALITSDIPILSRETPTLPKYPTLSTRAKKRVEKSPSATQHCSLSGRFLD